MTSVEQRATCRVWLNKREVIGAYAPSATYSYLRRYTSALFHVDELPDWARPYQPVTIEMGPDAAHNYLRFTGLYVKPRYPLWPPGIQMQCYGFLYLTEVHRNTAADGTDLAAPSGTTGKAQVEAVLDACGLTVAALREWGGITRYITSTGKILGTWALDQFTWGYNEKGLDYIGRLDDAELGYRTFELPGAIVRDQTGYQAGINTALVFTEGIDLLEGTDADHDVTKVFNKVAVTGYDDGAGAAYAERSQASPFLPAGTTYVEFPWSSGMLEKDEAADPGDGISCGEWAEYKLPEVNRKVVNFRLRTYSGEVIYPGMTGRVVALTKLGYSDRAWVQEVTCGISRAGVWSQDVQMQGGVGTEAPIDRPPMASFDLFTMVEKVISGGAEASRYDVACRAVDIGYAGTIASYAWTATGGNPSSGTGPTFTTSYDDPADKEISLTVTDSVGQASEPVTKSPPAATSPLWVRRPLYTAETGQGGCYSGAAWAVHAMNGGVTGVSNGPVWGSGDRVYYSTDYLATVSYSVPKVGVNVTALYVETDVSGQKVLCGLADGSVFKSLDGGATWVSLGTPEASAILKVVINRYSPGQYFALTGAAYYDTVDEGLSWTALHTAPEGYTWYDVAHSWDRGYLLVGDDGAGNPYAVDSGGVEQAFAAATAGCYAVAARILGGYAVLLSDGTTWLSASGSAEFNQATDLPAGCTPLPRSLWRDGAVADLYYIAGGTGGAWKSIDGFGSAGGYYQIRAQGVGTCAADADVRQIGADGLLAAGAITPVEIVTDNLWKVLSLWNAVSGANDSPPDDWNGLAFDDSGWVFATELGASSIDGADIIWDALLNDIQERVCLRRSFTIGAGVISGGSYQTRSYGEADHYCNGFYFATTPAGYDALQTVTIPANLLITGTNVLAVLVKGGS